MTNKQRRNANIRRRAKAALLQGQEPRANLAVALDARGWTDQFNEGLEAVRNARREAAASHTLAELQPTATPASFEQMQGRSRIA